MTTTIAASPVRRLAGFTLIELLTVIAIIGILAAILIPTVAKVRENARMTQSLANLRSIGAGINNYVAERRGLLPMGAAAGYGAPRWSDASEVGAYLSPRIDQPAGWEQESNPAWKSQSPTLVSPVVPHGSHHRISDYGCNIEVLRIGTALPFSSLERPSRIAVVMSASPGSAEMKKGTWYINTIGYRNNNGKPSTSRHSDWETGRMQIVFADGHVESMPMKTFEDGWKEYLFADPSSL
ncbi:prepilin-type N-terminal cleavage/methylation domain-containing protein [Opitutaceae bacterium TAV1]|nr:prepilin-type N-terminal cleavage/methylation domain-containing protein [Opitutaceae bacterium TAV1]